MLHAGHSSTQLRSVITITGLGDHDQPDWLITMTGIRKLTDNRIPSVVSAASARAATASMSCEFRKYSTSDSTIRSKRPSGHSAGMARRTKRTHGRSSQRVRAVCSGSSTMSAASDWVSSCRRLGRRADGLSRAGGFWLAGDRRVEREQWAGPGEGPRTWRVLAPSGLRRARRRGVGRRGCGDLAHPQARLDAAPVEQVPTSRR